MNQQEGESQNIQLNIRPLRVCRSKKAQKSNSDRYLCYMQRPFYRAVTKSCLKDNRQNKPEKQTKKQPHKRNKTSCSQNIPDQEQINGQIQEQKAKLSKLSNHALNLSRIKFLLKNNNQDSHKLFLHTKGRQRKKQLLNKINEKQSKQKNQSIEIINNDSPEKQNTFTFNPEIINSRLRVIYPNYKNKNKCIRIKTQAQERQLYVGNKIYQQSKTTLVSTKNRTQNFNFRKTQTPSSKVDQNELIKTNSFNKFYMPIFVRRKMAPAADNLVQKLEQKCKKSKSQKANSLKTLSSIYREDQKKKPEGDIHIVRSRLGLKEEQKQQTQAIIQPQRKLQINTSQHHHPGLQCNQTANNRKIGKICKQVIFQKSNNQCLKLDNYFQSVQTKCRNNQNIENGKTETHENLNEAQSVILQNDGRLLLQLQEFKQHETEINNNTQMFTKEDQDVSKGYINFSNYQGIIVEPIELEQPQQKLQIQEDSSQPLGKQKSDSCVIF